MIIHIFQHVPFEGPAAIETWLREKGHTLRFTRFYEHSAITMPPLKGAQGLVVMGGPMGAQDENRLPWMAGEKAYIKGAMDAGVPVLGVCLGAQLMASALGARVYPNREKEIGWHKVQLTAEGVSSGLLGLQAEFEAFHWHGDTFDLPAGAAHLARSEACKHQAFRWGKRALALQFHVEMTPESLEEMCKHGAGELKAGGAFVQGAPDILKDRGACGRLKPHLDAALSALFT